jgi:hypothetical protein
VVNAGLKSCWAVLVLALAVLTATAALRSAEYDEQYTMFLTAGVARPVWPDSPFVAADVRALQAGHGSLIGIARDLRATDVHPPLYFWAVALWRRLTGGGLFLARLFSVLCGVAALAAVGVVAYRTGVPPALAMLLTLGCYGFAYTAAIARGFALAQALTLWGVAVALSGRRGWAGLLLGAATFANYLAVFSSLPAPWLRHARSRGEVAAWSTEGDRAGGRLGADRPDSPLARRRHALTPPACGAGGIFFAPFLLADLWFFLAQRNSRAGQFPSFHLLTALPRLARYAAANLLGGLPLYVPVGAQPAAAGAFALLALGAAVLVAARWRHIAAPPAARCLLLAAALATPAGLLALGAIFHNTPIELRYLAFATPFAALLLAGALASLPAAPRRVAITLVAIVQAASLAGLMTRPETMQPAQATAAAAARFAGGGIVLVPRGNDGVGIVGAFAIESPPAQRLLVVGRGETPAQILARVGTARRVVLALLAQDDDSRATIPMLRAAFATHCWRRTGDGFNVIAFDRVCDEGAPWVSSTTSP